MILLGGRTVNSRAYCAQFGFTGADQDYIDSFFVPGIQRAGGLRAARQLAGAQ